MSSWREYLVEKAKIDDLVTRGYHIMHVTESFDGDDVRFVRTGSGTNPETEDVRLLTAEGRKYMGTVLIAQLQTSSVKN